MLGVEVHVFISLSVLPCCQRILPLLARPGQAGTRSLPLPAGHLLQRQKP